MLKRILAGAGLLLLVLAVSAFFLPREVTVTRAITINVEPDLVFAQVNDLKAQNTWSAWALRDPAMQVTYSGPASGTGMKAEWVSDSEGSGSQTITESVSNTRVVTALDFGMGGFATGRFELERAEGGTRLTWSLYSDTGFNPLARWFGLFMDGMVGPDFETGLLNLKAKLEGRMQADAGDRNIPGAVPSPASVIVQQLVPPPNLPETAPTTNPADAPRIVTLEPRPVAYARGSVKFTPDMTPERVQEEVRGTYQRVENVMRGLGLMKDGNTMIITSGQDPAQWDFVVAVPIAVMPPSPAPVDGVAFGPSPAGRAVMAVHRGPYANIPATRDRIASFIAAEGLTATRLMWEEYLTSPSDTAQDLLETHVYQGLE
ncbi:MAG TPA: SRPBCC family protein [Micropepsaceae bacterium]|nr:SRPBCC family protein [Micropepsaceae bacterium]